jgi:hypothetical protein
MERTVGDIAKQGLTELPMTLADELAGLLRGSAKTTLGAPGDINELARDYVVPALPYRFRQILEGLQNAPAAPTSEELGQKWSPVVPQGADPYRKIAARAGEAAGEWAPVDPFAVAGMAGRTAGRGLKAVDQAIAIAPAAGSRAAQRGVIKMPGGNWLSEHALEEELKKFKNQAVPVSNAEEKLAKMIEKWPESEINKVPESQQRMIRNSFNSINKSIALNKWVDSNLANYVKKQMGTEGDPIRALAEQGITHRYLGDRYDGNPGGYTAGRRVAAGFPEEGFGISPEARSWEHASDVAIRPIKATDLLAQDSIYQVIDPWLTKIDPNTFVHKLNTGSFDELGFDKLMLQLDSDLASGRIRPEQLNKISVPDAVQRVHITEEAERKAKEAAEAEALRANLAINPYKEYPSGHKWVELPDAADSPENLKTIQDIGCQGGWCTQDADNALAYGGTNYEEKQLSRLYALLDKSGKPHAQIHVVPGENNRIDFDKNIPQDIKDKLMAKAQAKSLALQNSPFVTDRITPESQYKWLALMHIENNPYHGPQVIDQIQPMSNSWDSQMVADQIKKNPNYRKEIEPMVQDFVRSGNWQSASGVENAGLMRTGREFSQLEKETLTKLGHEVPRYATPEEVTALKTALEQHSGEVPIVSGDERPALVPNLDLGLKRGGKVNLEDQYRLNKLNGTILGTQYRM